MVPADDDVDLLKVTVVCKEILCEPDSQQLTGRELRQRIAQSMRVNVDLLASDSVQQHLDTVVLEHFLGQRPPAEGTKRFTASKREGKPEPKRTSFSASKGNAPVPVSDGDNVQVASRPPPSKRPASACSKASDKIDRLKSYINKCGVRKLWKRELDGLSERQQIARLEEILHGELGMGGRPTLEKCKAIKERREFEEELRALDPNNVLPTKLRSQGGSRPSTHNGDEDDDEEEEPLHPPTRPKLDLSAFGDSEGD